MVKIRIKLNDVFAMIVIFESFSFLKKKIVSNMIRQNDQRSNRNGKTIQSPWLPYGMYVCLLVVLVKQKYSFFLHQVLCL